MMMKFSKLSWIFILALPLFFAACGNDDDADPEPQSIVEIAAGDDQFSTLVDALTRVGLVSVLEGSGPFTVFAPTNDAFTASGVDLSALTDEQLTEVLLYHVLGAEITSSAIQEGQTYTTTAANTAPGDNQLSLLIEKTGSAVQLNGSVNVTTADVDATNGVIHIIDDVLLPLDVVGHAIANSNFSSLVTTLGAASGDLVTTLQTAGPFTVFAPLNSAFDAISATTATLDADQLAKVLLYHVVSGNVRSTALSNGQVVESLNDGLTFTVNIDGSVTITDANGGTSTVILTDVQGTNGVIHVLDAVIIPSNL
ncbi:MAG: transforming growth factor-beta-induced protein [Saprospiraceae bacterium]|jgi:transforming growth factor-beta-induced protein